MYLPTSTHFTMHSVTNYNIRIYYSTPQHTYLQVHTLQRHNCSPFIVRTPVTMDIQPVKMFSINTTQLLTTLAITRNSVNNNIINLCVCVCVCVHVLLKYTIQNQFF